MSGLGIFSQACLCTFDSHLQSVLQLCAKGKYPSQFKVTKGRIVTTKGNTFEISRDPMEVCNLVYMIINGQEKSPKAQYDVLESKMMSRVSRSSGMSVGVSDDAIFSFAKREAQRLGRDDYYRDQLKSCIFTAILLGDISPSDFELDGEKILSIRGIDTKVPCISVMK